MPSIFIAVAKNHLLEKNYDEGALADLISEGYISKAGDSFRLNFPVLSAAQFKELCTILQPVSEEMAQCIKNAVAAAAKVLQNHVPAQLKGQSDVLAHITRHIGAMGAIMEQMCEKGYLIVPNTPEKLTMFLVLADKT
jgi:hypothetical protein